MAREPDPESSSEKKPAEPSIQAMTVECLENLAARLDAKTTSKFEKFFLPALAVFSAIIIGMFMIIYSITQDMTRLADAIDPQMGTHMTSMTEHVGKLSVSLEKMSRQIETMNRTLGTLSGDMTAINRKMDTLAPLGESVEEMNQNAAMMRDSIIWMQHDISSLRRMFARPMKTAVPFL